MKKYKLYWMIAGKTEIIEGANIVDAFTRAGYSAGAVRALDWYEEVTEDEE